jgi:hypothetical protein
MAILKGRVDGLEYKVEELSAGAFSEATKLTGSAVFTTGFEDTNSSTDNKLTSEYNFKIDLNTSFVPNGGDRFYAGIETGNQGDLDMDSQVTATNAEALELESLFYQFPVGNFKVTAGPLLDQDDVISAKVTDYSSAFRLEELPYGAVGTTGAGAGVEFYADNGFNGSFNLIATEANDSTQGAFTLEGSDLWTASIGYDAESGNYGGGAVYTNRDNGVTDNVDTSFGVGAYFRPEGMPTISVTYDQLTDNDATDSSHLLIGFDYPVGPGIASAAMVSNDNAGTTVNEYEVYYKYAVNDSMDVQGGIFVEESATANTDNTQGVVVETFFRF